MDSFNEEYSSYDNLQKEVYFIFRLCVLITKSKKYCTELKTELQIPHNEDLIFNFCNNLYKIIVKVKNLNNEIFEGIDKDDKMYCFTLKYWLYDQMVNIGARGLKINEHFEKWQKGIKDKINEIYSNPCTFNELTEDQYNKLKRIYAFVLLYYNNINVIREKNFVLCKYLNFFGEGLKAYYKSLSECSTEKENDNYCKEFNEFQKLYGLDNIHWKNSTLNTGYKYSEDSTLDCPLVIESSKDPLKLIYKEENNILYLTDQPVDIQSNSIVSASSAIGATVGISAFLLYLYKDNIMFDNMDTDTHNFTSSTFEIGSTHFENSDYNILYSLNNSKTL
ncbi:PIR protein [Plasmodium ovale]|uniref:PIR protein n=1 Tax=Plasmodium ovale TaxID=36330 RepID=A0A1D3JFV9_PLAOA|nr:PIR protein [Plasmodium ovale]